MVGMGMGEGHGCNARGPGIMEKKNDKKERGMPLSRVQIGQSSLVERDKPEKYTPLCKTSRTAMGPFTVIQALPSGIDFRLKLLAQWKIHLVFHTSLLTPYKETEEHGRNFEQLPLELIEGEPEYEVEQVLSSRRVGHKKKALQYLLRWKGYSQAHDSWEPANQVHASKLVKEFYNKNPLAIHVLSSPLNSPILLDTSQPHSPSFYLMQPLINYVTNEKYTELKNNRAIV